MSLDLPEGNLPETLRLFGDVSGLNVVVEPGIPDGPIRAWIHDVAWDNVLELILRSRGLWYELKGNLLHIVPDLKRASEVTVRRLRFGTKIPSSSGPSRDA